MLKTSLLSCACFLMHMNSQTFIHVGEGGTTVSILKMLGATV